MRAPLWFFFTVVRKRIYPDLSIDQYFYFLSALHRMPNGTLQTIKDIKKLCKLFWLLDSKYESQFDRQFDLFEEQCIELIQGQVIRKEEDNIEEINQQIEEKDLLTPEQAPIIEEEDILPTPTSGNTTVKEQEAEFELVIKNSEIGIGDIQHAHYEHSFTLSDHSIMPFRLRHIAQRLRRKVETTTKVTTDESDIEKMIEQYCNHGYIDDISLIFKDASKSNIVLLSDRYGSMIAYSYLEQHLSDTFSTIPACQFEHYFFFNTPVVSKQDSTHFELRVVQPSDKEILDTTHANWNGDTWFFIFSDAGAHSGVVNKKRILKTLKIWKYFNNLSKNVFWLNPVPSECMNDCTASRLGTVIPMVYPYEKNLVQLINTQTDE